MKLNELASAIHADNAKWWQDPKTGQRIDRPKPQLLALIASELSEAMEGERKDLMDDHLPHRKMAEVEMADVIIRIMDYSGAFGLVLSMPSEPPQPLLDDRASAIWQIHTQLVLFDLYQRGWPKSDTDLGRAMGMLIRLIMAYCEKFGHDLEGAIAEKRAYNLKRADHSFEARLSEGGKKW